MIKRFSLYGFLKNQRYYEPFILLFFLDKGLSFTQVGFLVAFREFLINACEIPSGAIADIYGRRKCMIVSFVSYIISFVIFGFSTSYWHFFAAMIFFSTGEAFRTGTHKAMIFTWLRLEGRTDEKTKVYGYTRSWSKLGSAFSIIIATACVLLTKNYTSVFFLSIIPYMFGLVNFLSYPAILDGKVEKNVHTGDVTRHLFDSIRLSFRKKPLRRLISESMAFEGVFSATKDYIQPAIKTMVVTLPVFMTIDDKARSAMIIGIVYFILHLASAWASRRSHKVSSMAGGEEMGARLIWNVVLVLYLAMAFLFYFEIHYIAIVFFVCLYLVQNLWRPIQISRFDEFSTEEKGATILSIESQAKALSTMMIAPAVGFLVDLACKSGQGGAFWPVGLAGTAAALTMILTGRRGKRY